MGELIPVPRFLCHYSEHQFDIRTPVAIVFVLRLPSIGTVSSCSPLIPIRPLLSASPFPLFSFLICAFLCVSFVVSSCRLARASRFVRLGCVVSSVLSVLPVRLARRSACRLDRLVVSVWRRSVLLFARSRLVCRGGLALRSRAVLVSHWHPVCPSSRSSSCRSVPPAVSSCSSRSRSSSRSRRPGGGVRVRSRVRTVPPCSSLVPVRLFGLGSCPLSWGGAVRHGHGAGTACSYRLIRPLMVPARYFAHSLRDGSVEG